MSRKERISVGSRNAMHGVVLMIVVVTVSLSLAVVRPASAQSPPAANSGGTAVGGAARHRANTLNPQPLPPVDKPSAGAKALNPQPLPPVDKPGVGAKALNPQPLPPIDKPGAGAKALNPQPLPPIDKPVQR